MRSFIYNMIFIAFSLTQLNVQGIAVSGTVTDNAGIPVPGVNVIEENTSKLEEVVVGYDKNKINLTGFVVHIW